MFKGQRSKFELEITLYISMRGNTNGSILSNKKKTDDETHWPSTKKWQTFHWGGFKPMH